MLSIFTFFSCRAVVAHKGKVIPLSRDFTPETERQRVQLIVRITFIVVFQKVHNAEMRLFVCLLFFFFHASCIRQRSIHSFLTPIFLFISITCHVYQPRAHDALPFQTCMPRAFARASYHKCSVTGQKVVACWLQKVRPKGVRIYLSCNS